MVRPGSSIGLVSPKRGIDFRAMTNSLETVDLATAREEVERGDALAVDLRTEEPSPGAPAPPGAIRLPGGLAGIDGQLAPKGTRLMILAANPLDSARAAAQLRDLGYDAVAISE